MVVGVWLIVIGVFEVVSAFGIRKATKNAWRSKNASRPRPNAAGELTLQHRYSTTLCRRQ